jgi:hypothetical protein
MQMGESCHVLHCWFAESIKRARCHLGGNRQTHKKCSFFFAFKITDSMQKLAKLYIQEIVKLHRVAAAIVSNRDP